MKSHHCLKSGNRVLSMSGIAVVGVQREQEGAEYIAPGGPPVFSIRVEEA